MRAFLPFLCALSLAACSTGAPQGSTAIDVTAPAKDGFEITGTVSEGPPAADQKYVPSDPSVSVYATEGPLVNPLNTDRTHSVLDNTTAGGYTVFDESVKVFPLPGEDVPAYLPEYSVPPLEGQYAKKQDAGVGQPMGLASAGMLPPVPNVDVRGVPVRKPMSLTSPEPLTMQPPAQARPPMTSPFDALGHITAAPAPAKPASVTMPAKPASVTTPGRRSAPLLTGY